MFNVFLALQLTAMLTSPELKEIVKQSIIFLQPYLFKAEISNAKYVTFTAVSVECSHSTDTVIVLIQKIAI